jgi:hypothetical protein
MHARSYDKNRKRPGEAEAEIADASVQEGKLIGGCDAVQYARVTGGRVRTTYDLWPLIPSVTPFVFP